MDAVMAWGSSSRFPEKLQNSRTSDACRHEHHGSRFFCCRLLRHTTRANGNVARAIRHVTIGLRRTNLHQGSSLFEAGKR